MVAANGFVSVLTGAEVEPVAAAGPLAVPLGIAAAAVLMALRAGFATARSTLLPIELLLLAALCLIVAPSLVALLSGPGQALLTLGGAATSPFTLAAGGAAALAGVVVLLVVRARAAGAGRPRWPWERDEDP